MYEAITEFNNLVCQLDKKIYRIFQEVESALDHADEMLFRDSE